ncbi:MAG: lipoprotein [Pseudomonadota bacterium]
MKGLVVVLAVLLLLGACGKRGPLELPPEDPPPQEEPAS